MKYALFLWFALVALVHAAGLEFEKSLLEVHAPADAATVTADFKFKNNSGQPVTIMKSDPGCSCLSVQVAGGKLKYGPGEEGLVRATFDMGNFSGTVDKAIGIWLDEDPPDKPSVKITVRVHIPVLIALEPKTLKWTVGGKPEPQTIAVTMAEGESIQLLSVKSSSEGFTTETKVIEKGRRYELVVTPRSLEAPVLGILRVETDCKIAKHRVQQAFAVVSKQAQVETAAKP
jgi:hypothetical protein